MTIKEYCVEFKFKSEHSEYCPFYEWEHSINPITKKVSENPYCRIFGVKYKCEAVVLNDTGFPKWCPIKEVIENEQKPS